MKVDMQGIQVKTISVTYERKMNLQDFNSGTIGCTIWANLDAGVDPQVASRTLFLIAKAQVREQVMPLVAKFRDTLRLVVSHLRKEDQAQFDPSFATPSLDLILATPEEGANADQVSPSTSVIPEAGPRS